MIQLHTVGSHFRFVWRGFLYLKLRKTLSGVVSETNRKLLLWLQEYYIYYKFKSNDFLFNPFCSYVFMFILWDTEEEIGKVD
jgi:hypothetical protein